MYPHVKQFETRRQELEQRFGTGNAARVRSRAAGPSRSRLGRLTRLLGGRPEPRTDP
jgi:hypothetical protein